MITLFDEPSLQNVTAQMARAWLLTVKEDCYRPVSELRVNQFAQAMRDDQWEPTPLDPILFDVLGQVRSGRMRLMAVAGSGCAVDMYVQTSPPLQEHEIVPGVYSTGSDDPARVKVVHAVRWDGESFGSARRWMQGDSRDTVSIEMDASRKLTVETQRGIFWVYPGDWLVHGDDGYRKEDHFSFAGSFAYRGKA